MQSQPNNQKNNKGGGYVRQPYHFPHQMKSFFGQDGNIYQPNVASNVNRHATMSQQFHVGQHISNHQAQQQQPATAQQQHQQAVAAAMNHGRSSGPQHAAPANNVAVIANSQQQHQLMMQQHIQQQQQQQQAAANHQNMSSMNVSGGNSSGGSSANSNANGGANNGPTSQPNASPANEQNIQQQHPGGVPAGANVAQMPHNVAVSGSGMPTAQVYTNNTHQNSHQNSYYGVQGHPAISGGLQTRQIPQQGQVLPDMRAQVGPAGIQQMYVSGNQFFYPQQVQYSNFQGQPQHPAYPHPYPQHVPPQPQMTQQFRNYYLNNNVNAQQAQQQPKAAPPQKREKKMIKIEDPNTGTEVELANLVGSASAAHSRQSSTSQGGQARAANRENEASTPEQQNDFRANFAANVAKAAVEPNITDPRHASVSENDDIAATTQQQESADSSAVDNVVQDADMPQLVQQQQAPVPQQTEIAAVANFNTPPPPFNKIAQPVHANQHPRVMSHHQQAPPTVAMPHLPAMIPQQQPPQAPKVMAPSMMNIAPPSIPRMNNAGPPMMQQPPHVLHYQQQGPPPALPTEMPQNTQIPPPNQPILQQRPPTQQVPATPVLSEPPPPLPTSQQMVQQQVVVAPPPQAHVEQQQIPPPQTQQQPPRVEASPPAAPIVAPTSSPVIAVPSVPQQPPKKSESNSIVTEKKSSANSSAASSKRPSPAPSSKHSSKESSPDLSTPPPAVPAPVVATPALEIIAPAPSKKGKDHHKGSEKYREAAPNAGKSAAAQSKKSSVDGEVKKVTSASEPTKMPSPTTTTTTSSPVTNNKIVNSTEQTNGVASPVVEMKNETKKQKSPSPAAVSVPATSPITTPTATKTERASVSPSKDDVSSAAPVVEASPPASTGAKEQPEKKSPETEDTSATASARSSSERDSSVEKDTAEEDVSASVSDAEPAKPARAEIKYQYKENQWSPANTSGAKAYDKKFLLEIKSNPITNIAPKNLPDLDVVRGNNSNNNNNNNNNSNNRGGGGGFDRNSMNMMNSNKGGIDFMTPNWMQGSHRDKGGYSSQQGHRGSNSMRGNKKVQKVIDAKPSSGKSALKTTENAWKPGDSGNDDSDEKASKKLRGIMNKICPETFDKLKNEFRELFVQNEKRIEILVILLFDKACGEQHFAGEYAKLCKFVVEPPVNSATSKFRQRLLVKCQNEFEKKHKEENTRRDDMAKSLAAIKAEGNLEIKAEKQKKHDEKFVDKSLQERLKLQDAIEACPDARKKKQLQDELEALQDASRRKSVGLIKFVADLYKEELLTTKIVSGIFTMLVKDIARSEQAEILCKLFLTIGSKMTKDGDENEKKEVKANVEKMRKHAEYEPDARIRFLVMDAVELFDQNFVARHRSQLQVGPSTKKEVLNKMNAEQLQQARDLNSGGHGNNNNNNNNNNNRQNDRFRRGDRGSQGRDGPHSENSDLWNTVVNSGSGTKRIPTLTSFRGNSSSAGGEQRLGPSTGFGGWARGASGGIRDNIRSNPPSSSSNNNPIPTKNNRFAAFMQEDVELAGPETPQRRVIPINRFAPRDNPFQKDNRDNRDNHGRNSYSGDSFRQGGTDRSNSMGRRIPSQQPSDDVRSNKSMNRERSNSPNSASGGFGASGGASGHGPSSSRQSSAAAASAPAPVEEMSREELDTRMRSTFDEYCSVKDLREAMLDIKERILAKNVPAFIEFSLMEGADKKLEQLQTIGKLIAELFVQKLINNRSFIEGCTELMSMMGDLAIDIPRVTDNIAAMICPSLMQGHLTLPNVWTLAQKTDAGNKVKLFMNILQQVASVKEEDALKMFEDSGLTWAEVFRVGEKERPYDILDMLERYKLTELYLPEDGKPVEYYVDFIEKKKIDVTDRPAMKAMVKKLVSPLVKCSSGSEVDISEEVFERLCDRFEALKKCVPKNSLQIELSVLHALQAIAVKHGVPKGLLPTLFDAAHNASIVSIDSMKAWSESTDKEEENGLGMCVTSVQAFIRGLQSKSNE